ncbi:MAG: TRAP transporter substrate-binding protein DctP [Chloroflexota bacterium]
MRLWQVAVVFLLLGALLIGGCAQATPSPSPKATPAPSPSPAASPKPAPTGTVITLKYMSQSQPNVAAYDWVVYFAKKVEELSQGRLKLEVYTEGQLAYKVPAYLEVVRDDLVPLIDTMTGSVAGAVPELQLAELPMLMPEASDVTKVLPALKPIMAKVLLDKWKSVLITAHPMHPQGLWVKKGINNLAGLKGTKIRTVSDEQSEWVTALGAAPVTLAAPELYSALQYGTVNGVVTSTSFVWSRKLYEVVGNQLLSGATNLTRFIAINKDSFAKLPPDLQKVLYDAGEATSKYAEQMIPPYEKEMETNLTGKGVTFNRLSPDEVTRARSLAAPIWEKWGTRNGATAQALLKTARDTLKY